MEESIQFNWSSLETLIPLCLEFCNRYKKDGDINLRDMVDKVGEAFGIEDVDAFADCRIQDGIENGLSQLFDGDESRELAEVFAAMCKPVAEAVFGYAKGEKNPVGFTEALGNIHLKGAEKLKIALQNIPGFPSETADVLAGKLGPYFVSMYCFSATYKIYRKVAQDAEYAKERRIEMERLSNEAIAQLELQRAEMECLLGESLLLRVTPFGEAVEAMDQAILLGGDDDFVVANSNLQALFGRKAQFESKQEFDSLMVSDEAFRL